MEEIKVKNELGLKVYINGTPDLTNVPPDFIEELILFFGA